MTSHPQATLLKALDASLVDAVVCFRVDGREIRVGRQSGAQTEHFSIRIHRPRFFAQVLCYGNLGLGEAFMQGDFEMERGCLHDFLTALLRNRIDEKIHRTARLALRVGWIRLWNKFRPRDVNVQRHYDIGDDLFDAFLDSTLTYSCGYLAGTTDSLEQAQLNKMDRICKKLRLQEGERLLDIGCGFGSLLIFAAKHYGITGTGLTISRRHFERGNAEIQRQGLADRIGIELRDYRLIRNRYQKIVSVGMLEHVSRSEYENYFRKIAAALSPGGMGLLHTIGCTKSENVHDPFIQKYVFPNSNQPRLSEIAVCLERSGLAILDVENIVRHYSYTILGWLARFRANRFTLDVSRYDQVFQRMWEYYLCCGIAAARASDAAVYQVLFHNDRTAEIPLKRV